MLFRSKVNETHDRALKVANDFKIKNDELVIEIVRLLEANEKFEKDAKSLEDSLAHLTKSHDQLQAQLLKELPTCSPIAINIDACATNSISCEASILKDNVELRAQLKLLTSNYEILEESHEKLSSSHEDLRLEGGE